MIELLKGLACFEVQSESLTLACNVLPTKPTQFHEHVVCFKTVTKQTDKVVSVYSKFPSNFRGFDL